MNKLTLKPSRPCPTEAEDCITLMEWRTIHLKRLPDLLWMYHVPNGEKREKIKRVNKKTGRTYFYSPTGSKLQQMGVRPGVSDYCIPAPRIGKDGTLYFGMYLEMKARDGDTPTDAQNAFLAYVRGKGYYDAVCYGFEEAVNAIEGYLGMKEWER